MRVANLLLDGLPPEDKEFANIVIHYAHGNNVSRLKLCF